MFPQMKLSSQHNNKPNRNLRNKEGKQNWNNNKSLIILGEVGNMEKYRIETSCFLKLENNKNKHTYPKRNPLEIYVGISTPAVIKISQNKAI